MERIDAMTRLILTLIVIVALAVFVAQNVETVLSVVSVPIA